MTKLRITAESGWDKFRDFIEIFSWDDVVEADVGDPTKEERNAIQTLGY